MTFIPFNFNAIYLMCKDHDTITYYKSKLWLYLLLFVVLSCRRGRIYVSQYNMRIGVCIYSVCWLSSCIVTPYGFITNLDLLEEWSLDSKELWEVGPLWSEALRGCFGSNRSTCPKILKYWAKPSLVPAHMHVQVRESSWVQDRGHLWLHQMDLKIVGCVMSLSHSS